MKITLIFTLIALVSSHAPPVSYLLLKESSIQQIKQPLFQPFVSKSSKVRNSRFSKPNYSQDSSIQKFDDNHLVSSKIIPAYSMEVENSNYNSAFAAKPVLSYFRNNIPKIMKQFYPITKSSSLSSRSKILESRHFKRHPSFYKIKLFNISKQDHHDYMPIFLNKNLYPTQTRSNNFINNINDCCENKVNQKEVGDEIDSKKSSYGYEDDFGVYRNLDYVTDQNGFRATIKTNEPKMSNNFIINKRLNHLPQTFYSPSVKSNSSPPPTLYTRQIKANFLPKSQFYFQKNKSRINTYLNDHDFRPSLPVNYDLQTYLNQNHSTLDDKYNKMMEKKGFKNVQKITNEEIEDNNSNDEKKQIYNFQSNSGVFYNSEPKQSNFYKLNLVQYRSKQDSYHSEPKEIILYKPKSKLLNLVTQKNHYKPVSIPSEKLSSPQSNLNQFSPYISKVKNFIFYETLPNQNHQHTSEHNEPKHFEDEEQENFYEPQPDLISNYDSNSDQTSSLYNKYELNKPSFNNKNDTARNEVFHINHHVTQETDEGYAYENFEPDSISYNHESDLPSSFNFVEAKSKFYKNHYDEKPTKVYTTRSSIENESTPKKHQYSSSHSTYKPKTANYQKPEVKDDKNFDFNSYDFEPDLSKIYYHSKFFPASDKINQPFPFSELIKTPNNRFFFHLNDTVMEPKFIRKFEKNDKYKSFPSNFYMN